MRMKMIDVLHMPRRLWLGRKTEQNFRPIAFDVYKWLTDYPEATVSIIYTRPDGQIFPVASSDRSPIIWIPQQDVTTVSGEGEIELHLVGGGAVGISASTKTLIDDSAASAQPTAPSWVDQVVQDVTEQADRAEEAADSIEGSITEKVNEVVPDAVADYMEDHPVTVEETDPTVPEWAKQPTKPTYTAAEVGALPDSTVIPDISGKVDKVEGKGLSTNDFTSADKAKLDGIESGAQKNTVTSVNGMTGDVVVETSGGGAVDSVNGETGAVVLDASDVGALPADTPIPAAVTEQTVAGWGFTKNTGTYSKPSGGIPASDLATAVQTSLGKADTALQPDALQTELDDNVPPARFVLVKNGNTITTVDTFLNIAMSLTSTARRVMFVVVLAQSGGNPTSILELYPTLIDRNNRLLALVGEYDGDRYTTTLTATSASSTMTGTLVVEPIVKQSDIPSLTGYATEAWVHNQGYQTAQQVQTAIENAAELPTGGSTGDFLRKTASGVAWETVQTWQGGSY